MFPRVHLHCWISDAIVHHLTMAGRSRFSGPFCLVELHSDVYDLIVQIFPRDFRLVVKKAILDVPVVSPPNCAIMVWAEAETNKLT